MAALRGLAAARIFLCFAAAYFLSYAFRSINAVIAPDLQADIGLQNADLGLLSSAYFLSFAALQLPLGIWLDKYGPRRTESALLLFAAAGAAIFASSDSLAGLWLGRMLIGVGVSACLMAPFKAYRQWFASDQQSRLASWMLVAGTSGALAATVPVSAALPVIGWRGVFWLMSGMIVATSALIFFLLRKVEASQHASQAKPAAPGVAPLGYGHIFSDPFFRRMGLLGIVNHGCLSAWQTLWAGPWMMTVLGMSKQQTAQILFVFNLCLMLSYLGMSWWAPRHVAHAGSRGFSSLRVIGTGLGGTILVQLAMLSTSAPSSWALWLVLAACVTVTTLTQTSVSLAFPVALAGRANSAFNLMVFVGSFIVQWGVGLLIDMFSSFEASPPDAMRGALAICIAAQALALFTFVANRATPSAH
ncbi:MFS transporter [Noviherbaspirillum sp. ST9]|uniref:MFS transporter n=1 Tax=Noviherbaspirillum sp. ST9 TaxID=3401606 RepID=UPI003B58884F